MMVQSARVRGNRQVVCSDLRRLCGDARPGASLVLSAFLTPSSRSQDPAFAVTSTHVRSCSGLSVVRILCCTRDWSLHRHRRTTQPAQWTMASQLQFRARVPLRISEAIRVSVLKLERAAQRQGYEPKARQSSACAGACARAKAGGSFNMYTVDATRVIPPTSTDETRSCHPICPRWAGTWHPSLRHCGHSCMCDLRAGSRR
jgi:hypothetical protein